MGRLKPALNSLNAHLKCADSGGDIHLVLLQICATPLGLDLPSLATLLFNQQVCGVMPVINRKPIGGDNENEYHSKLVHRQCKNNTNNDTSQVFAHIPIGSTVAVQ